MPKHFNRGLARVDYRAIACIATALALSGCQSEDALPGPGRNDPSTVPAATRNQGADGRSDSLSQIREEWRQTMSKIPLPKAGCFQAVHPGTSWEEVPCVKVKPRPLVPVVRPETVGNGAAYSAGLGSGTISTAAGSFQSVTGVTSLIDSMTGTSNQYTLQVNTNTFAGSSICSGAANPNNCQGWQQYVYDNDASNSATYMQYWILNYVNTCPSGWNSFGVHCYKNSDAASVPVQSLSNLGNLALAGTVIANGMDSVTMSTGGSTLVAAGQDSVLNAAQGWRTAEFNIFGFGNGSQANFNNGVTISLRIGVTSGQTASPNCEGFGFTGETTNVNLVPSSCCSTGGASPTIVFKETNGSAAVTLPFCLLNDVTPILSPFM